MEHIVGFRDGLHHGRRDFLRFAGLGIVGSLLPSVAFGGRPLNALNDSASAMPKKEICDSCACSVHG